MKSVIVKIGYIEHIILTYICPYQLYIRFGYIENWPFWKDLISH